MVRGKKNDQDDNIVKQKAAKKSKKISESIDEIKKDIEYIEHTTKPNYDEIENKKTKIKTTITKINDAEDKLQEMKDTVINTNNNKNDNNKIISENEFNEKIKFIEDFQTQILPNVQTESLENIVSLYGTLNEYILDCQRYIEITDHSIINL